MSGKDCSELLWPELAVEAISLEDIPMAKRKPPPARRPRKPTRPGTDRQERDRRDIETDPLLKEVSEANARIANPQERERVIRSRPC